MKILKPGKVEMRKLTCPKCGCEFVANTAELKENRYCTWVVCPQKGCEYSFNVSTDNIEPYEEPVQDDRERLIALLDTNCGYTEEIPAATLADELLEHGVTFREAAMEGMEEEP